MLHRFKQIAVQIEAQEGVHETGEASGDLLTVKDLDWKPEFERYEPDTVQLSMTPTKPRKSRNSGTLTFKVELAGAAAGLTTDPPIAKLLRACGLRMFGDQAAAGTPFGGSGQIGRVFYVDAEASWTTGSVLEHGTAVTDGSTGGGVVLGSYRTGVAQRIWIRQTTSAAWATGGVITATGIAIDYTGDQVLGGRAFVPADKPTYYLKGTLAGTIAAGDIVTGVTSGAKALVIEAFNSGAELLVERAPGFGFFATGETVRRAASNEITSIQAPVQFDIPTLSITYYEDGNRVRVAGCRGSGTLRFEGGKPVLLELTMMGLHHDEGTVAMFPTAAPLEAEPPSYLGANITIDRTFHPLISTLAIDLGRETAKRSDVEKPAGYGFTASTGRKIVGTMDPETVHEAIFPFIGKAKDVVTFEIRTRLGTGGTGNAFDVMMPAVVHNVEPGERDGQSIMNQNLEMYSLAGIRGDEFALFTF